MTVPTRRRRQSHAPDGATQHRGWLDLVEISGPFLSLPVLRQAWPTLDALEKPTREALRREHAIWRDARGAGQSAWVRWVLAGLLGWGDELRESADELDDLAMDVAEHETRLVPSFALVEPGEDVKPATTRVLGLLCPPGHSPTERVPGSPWAATYVDRMAALCRHQGVELGLVTDGRWWALVWAPKDTATGIAVFDAVAWPEAAERDVVRAFSSILARSRFFGVRDDETLPALLHASLGSQEDITEALGSQVREAVELLVAALGREDLAARERGAPSLERVDAHEVYRGAVSVMMRIVFLLFAEERRLLPADNDLYASTYSAGQLCADLERRALEGSEDDLEYTTTGWHRLLAAFTAVHGGVDHPRLTMHAHDGSLFDPGEYPWLDLPVDDRTVLHMLRAVQYVEIGTGRLKERRSLSFRSLGVEEIGYVYEGLLAYDAFRAAEVVVGLVGKSGQEPEIELRQLEKIASGHTDLNALGGELSARFPNTGIGTAPAIAKKMRPLSGPGAEEARRKLLAASQGDAKLADRLTAFYGLLRQDLRELPMVIQPGALYVTDSPRRSHTGTHYTPRELAEEVVLHALEPLVYEPGPQQTTNANEWKLKSSKNILALKVADIAMGSAAFLVAAARYLGARLIEAWTREGDEYAQAYTVSDVQSDEDRVVVEARRQVIERCLYGVDINPMAVEMAKLSLWLVSMDSARPFTFLDDRLIAGDSLLGITSLEQLEYMHLDPVEGRRLHNDLLDWTHGVRNAARQASVERQKISELPYGDDALRSLYVKRALLYDAHVSVGRLSIFSDLLCGAVLAARGRTSTESERTKLLLESARLAEEVTRSGSEREALERSQAWLRTDYRETRFDSRCVHWPLEFPEVFDQGGFDAIVGNPPFLGGKKISGVWGFAYREYLVESIGHGVRGHADLVSYFLLRAHELLKAGAPSQCGLVATSTITEGDSREVGLVSLLAGGTRLRRVVSPRPWPSKFAMLEYCCLWTSQGLFTDQTRIEIDGVSVREIDASLRASSRASGEPSRLVQNKGIAYNGQYLMGDFTISPATAHDLLAEDDSNSAVLFRFLSGRDVNDDPGAAASRWTINFFDWSVSEAEKFSSCFEIVERQVKPDRIAQKDDYGRRYWWQYFRRRPELLQSIKKLSHVIVLTIHTKAVMPVRVSNNQVFSHGLTVFATDRREILALLSSALHNLWALSRGSSLGVSVRYTPSDVFETFPMPSAIGALPSLGEGLEIVRSQISSSRKIGITAVYNLASESSCLDHDVERLRKIHREIDEEAVRVYGWEDRIAAVGGLDHGFHKVGRETRYTIGPAAQREVLDSLLELNHERYAEEVAQGLHNKKKSSRAKKNSQEKEGIFDA